MRPQTTPQSRHPRPIFAGNIRNSGSGATARQTIGLYPGPVVGTAWELAGLSLTIVGPAPAISEDLNVDVLLSGEVVDSFEVDSSIMVQSAGVPPLPYTVAHDYASPFTVYDTDTLQLRFNFQETPAAAGYVDYRYRGNVSYLD